MEKIYLILAVTIALIFAGCGSTKTTTNETTTVDTHIVNIPVTPIRNDETLPWDTTSWHSETVTPAGDSIKTTITEVINPKKPKQKPSLHIVQTIIPAPVSYIDTTAINKTQSTQVIKAANPVMAAIGNFVSFVLKFLWWLIFGAAVIAGVVYAIKKKLIQALLK
ncbi:MAG: hypothetical protein ABR980_09470 [Ignavibacteriaceae bacterium]|jgi:hypothetical protein